MTILDYVDYDDFIDRNILKIVTSLDTTVADISDEDMQKIYNLADKIPTLRKTLQLEYKDYKLAEISHEDNTALIEALKGLYVKLDEHKKPVASRMLVQLCIDLITGDILNEQETTD